MTVAVVIGGSVAGLATAATILKHFDDVILIEKDNLSGSVEKEGIQETAARRKSCQQYTQPHALLAAGATAMEKIAPGILKMLSDRGAAYGDVGGNGHVYDFQGVYPRIAADVPCVFASRRLLNECFQQLVLQNAGNRLHIRDQTKVAGLLWSKDITARRPPGVCGVLIAGGEEIAADAVIVADGRKSQLPHWLKEAGVKLPEPAKVDCKIKYASRWFKKPADFDTSKEFQYILINERPAGTRAALGLVVENGYVQVVLVDVGDNTLPGDEEGFMKFAETLPDPTLYQFIKRCEPITPISRFAGINNYMQGYHKLRKDWPQGLFVLGDAMLSFNPVYGQGMTVAAMEALEFDRILTKSLQNVSSPSARVKVIRDLGPKVQRRLLKCTAVPWDLACNEDLRYEDQGVSVIRSGAKRPPKWVRKYQDTLIIAGQRNTKVWRQMLQVLHLKASPATLLKPSMVGVVLSQALRKKKSHASVASGHANR